MSNYVDNLIKKLDSKEDDEVLKFGLLTLLQIIYGYSILTICSLIFHTFYQSIIVALTSSTLRSFSGGTHATSPARCTIIGTFIFILLGYFSKSITLANNYYINIIIIVIITIISIYVIYIYSYATTHKKSLGIYKHGRKLRKIAISIILFWCAISCFLLNYTENIIINTIIVSSSMGILWHIFNLTKYGYNFSNLLDKLLKRIVK